MKTKNLFKSMLMAVCCVSVFAFASCSDDDDDKIDNTLKFTPEKIEVMAEESAKVVISNGKAPYTIAKSDIVTTKIDKDTIIVTGVKEGKATINITDKNDFSGELSVTVTAKTAPEALSFDKEEVTLAVEADEIVTIEGGTAPFTATVEDETIATAEIAENKITIKGVKAGTTTITVSDKEEVSGTISVTIE